MKFIDSLKEFFKLFFLERFKDEEHRDDVVITHQTHSLSFNKETNKYLEKSSWIEQKKVEEDSGRFGW